MAMDKNKVKFNLCNVHYALQQTDEDGTVSFGTPVHIPGAVSLSLDSNGEPSNFYADGYAYYVLNNNMGYEGDLELALIPENFRTDVLHEALDANNVLIENTSAEVARFALLFEFDGDQKKIRHVMYSCSASRPNIGSSTNEEEREVKTETLSIKATPMANGLVKAKTGDNTADAVYQGWYQKVYLPNTGADVDADTTLSALTIGGLTLTPEFDAEIIAYTVTTSNEADAVTAAAADAEATVSIAVNGAAIDSGADANWNVGANTVVVTVTNGTASRQYAVTVTREE